MHVKKSKNLGSEIDKQKEEVLLTKHEEKLYSRLCQDNYIEEEDYDEFEEGRYDDDD